MVFGPVRERQGPLVGPQQAGTPGHDPGCAMTSVSMSDDDACSVASISTRPVGTVPAYCFELPQQAHANFDIEFYESCGTHEDPIAAKALFSTANPVQFPDLYPSPPNDDYVMDDIMALLASSQQQQPPPPQLLLLQPEPIELVRKSVPAKASLSAPAQETSAVPRSKLHEALTATRSCSLPSSSPSSSTAATTGSSSAASFPSASSSVVRCTRCGHELSPRCLVQTCQARPEPRPEPRPESGRHGLVDSETLCKSCGSELTAKCILSQCCDSLSTFAYQG